MAGETIDLARILQEQQVTATKLSDAADTGSARTITKAAASAIGGNLEQTQETMRQISLDNILNVQRANTLTSQSVEGKASELEFSARVNEDVNAKNTGINNAIGGQVIKISEVAQKWQEIENNRVPWWKNPIKAFVDNVRADYLKEQIDEGTKIIGTLSSAAAANRDLGNQAIDNYQATVATRTAADLTVGAAAAKADFDARNAVTGAARAGQEITRRGALDLVGVAGDLEAQAEHARAEKDKRIQLYTPQINAILRGTGVDPSNASESQRMGAYQYFNALTQEGQQGITTVAASIDRMVRAGGTPSDSVVMQSLGAEATLDGLQSYSTLTGNRETNKLIEDAQTAEYQTTYTEALRQAAIDSLPTSGVPKNQIEQQIGQIRTMGVDQLVNQKIITPEQRKKAQEFAANAARNLTPDSFKSKTKALIENGDGLTPGMKLNFNGTDFTGAGWDKESLKKWGISDKVADIVTSPAVLDALRARPVVAATGLGDKAVYLRNTLREQGVPEPEIVTAVSSLMKNTAYSKAALANRGRVASYEAIAPGSLSPSAVVGSPAIVKGSGLGSFSVMGADTNKTLNIADPLDLREFYSRFDASKADYDKRAKIWGEDASRARSNSILPSL